MQAIATLIHDDPYLKMPKEERIALRKRRREMFRAQELPNPVVRVKRILIAPQDSVDLAPKNEKDFLAEWIKRQREISAPLPVPSNPIGRIRIVDIQRAVAAHFEVPITVMSSSRRHGREVLPRQIAMYLVKAILGSSLPEIGRRFGGRDHTTGLHAIRKIQNMIGACRLFASGVERLRLTIMEGRS